MNNANQKDETLEILLSTMNRSSLSFLEAMFPGDSYLNYNILIINQTTENKVLKSDHDNIRVINSFEKGLPQSRNLAIRNACGSICLIADDDVTYKPGFHSTILNGFKSYPDADIVTFQMVDDNEQAFRDYPDIERHTKNTIRTANSMVIAFRPDSLKAKRLEFNPNFGLGATFRVGDEYIFLRSALDAGLKIYFMPKVILSHPFYSSGKEFGSEILVFSRAAFFYKYSGFLGYLRLAKYLYLIYKQNYIQLNEIVPKFRTGMRGIKTYKELVSQGLE